jgi:hypothetical protein
MGDTSTGGDGRIAASAEAGSPTPQMTPPMRKVPAARMHARMMPATFAASSLVTTAALMVTAAGDDRMNRIDDAARCRRTLRPAACTVAAAHAATIMAAHSAGMTTAATAGKGAIGRNHRDAQGTRECQYRQQCAERS